MKPETIYLTTDMPTPRLLRNSGRNARPRTRATHAIFGFTGMLLKLLSQFRPGYVVVAIDTPGKTFRDDIYQEYKATRQATPDDLTAQVPRIFELLDLFGVPVIGLPGLEADDIIATITRRLLSDPAFDHINIRIVSRIKIQTTAFPAGLVRYSHGHNH
jgi:5'-3' exonuclease